MSGEGDEPVPVEGDADALEAEQPVEEAAPAEEEAMPEGEVVPTAEGDDEAAQAAVEVDGEAVAEGEEVPPEQTAEPEGDIPPGDDEEAPPAEEVAAPEGDGETPVAAEPPFASEGMEPGEADVTSPVAAEEEPEDAPSEGFGEDSARGSPSPDAFGEPGVDSAMMSGELSPGGGDSQADDVGDFGEEDDFYEEDQVDPLQELQEKYEQLLELNERAMQTNVALQRRVIQRKAQDKSYDASEKQSDGKVTEHKYQNVLLNVHSVRLKLRLQQVKAARMSEELKNQLEAKRQKAIECRDSFQEFKRQVARHAEYARTGKKIPEKIIQEVEEFELDKDAEVEEVRGSNISLKNRLSKLEQALRKKDELAENLHVIDFEQLKIENQTLNEKIEERNEELHKLRKKTIVTVQIITHMREKVQFVSGEYMSLKAELAQLELDLAAQRDTVTKTKHERDDIRAENAKYRQQTGITNSEGLSRDYEARAEHIKNLTADIAALKNRHKQMTQFVKRHGGKV